MSRRSRGSINTVNQSPLRNIRSTFFTLPKKFTASNLSLIQEDDKMKLRNSKLKKIQSQEILNQKVHDLFEKEYIENSLKNQLFNAFIHSNYDTLTELFDKDKYLEDRMPNINSKYKSDQNTLLHACVLKNLTKMAEFLIDLEADLNSKNIHGFTPLHLCVIYNNIEMSQLLLNCGADINCQDNEKYTPLMIATIKNRKELIEMLILHNSDVNCRNAYNQTCFDMINNYETYLLYLKYFNKKNSKDSQNSNKEFFINEYGRTPFLYKKYIKLNNRFDIMKNMEYKQNKIKNLLRHSGTFIDTLNEINRNDDMFKLLPPHPSINDFQIETCIGKGGFGEVFLANLKNTKNYYALKIMDKQRIFKDTAKKYVETERRVYEKLHHPFIPKFYRAFQSINYLYLLIENAEHGDLKGYLNKYVKFDEQTTVLIAAQIVLVLEHLHRQSIIYRDLKPDNILVDKNGYIKLADFGLCKEKICDNHSSRSFCGSIAYMAPEVITKKGHGRAVDWYLLGTVVFQMLTGKPCYYTTLGREELFNAVLYGQIKFSKYKISSNAQSFIKALIERNIEKRLGSGLSDAEEVKKHKFFKNIDFERIYQKKFDPPEILKTKIIKVNSPKDKKTTFINKNLKKDLNNDKCSLDYIHDKDYLPGWDFDGVFNQENNE